MSPRSFAPSARSAAAAVTLTVAAAAGFVSPSAGSAAGERWYSFGVLAGGVSLDPAFADYRWDVTPRAAWGAQGLVGTGAFAGGVRAWHSPTTQELGLADAGDPAVGVTSWDVVGQARLATFARTEVLALASVGRLHVAFDPDRVVTSGAGAPVAIDFAPIDEWNAAAGLGVRRALAGPWAATVEIDHRRFGMETAHRDGDQIAVGRRSFGDWSARIELSWARGR